MNSFQRCESIIIRDLPLPPSSNNQYLLVRRKGKSYHVSSPELKKFKVEMEEYPLKRPNDFIQNLSLIKAWKEKKLRLEFHSTFYFSYGRIFTKDHRPKKMDVSNRIKALHDCVASMLGMDDSIIFKMVAEKTLAKMDEKERVEIQIFPIMYS